MVVFGVSLASRGLYGGVEWIATLENYQRLADPLIGVIFLRSFIFAGMTTIVCALIGFPLAYVVARASPRWQWVWLTLVMIPFWTNFLVRTYAWILILRADGLVNSVLLRLGIESEPARPVPDVVKNRPPALCKGCGHIDMYNALGEALDSYGPGRVFSDIGCYTLGALPPYNAINSCVDMGASITMAKGASDAGLRPSVAVIGDSTFTHSGMTGLLDAVVEQTPLTIIISDNSTTGMTGGQQSHATNRLFDICRGIGVEEEHLRQMNPLRKHHEENMKMVADELAYEGVSVIVAQRECIQTASRSLRKEKSAKS